MKSTGEGKARFGLISLAHSKELPEAEACGPAVGTTLGGPVTVVLVGAV